jgi:hypothetical protein
MVYVSLILPSISIFWISFPLNQILDNLAPSNPADTLSYQPFNDELTIIWVYGGGWGSLRKRVSDLCRGRLTPESIWAVKSVAVVEPVATVVRLDIPHSLQRFLIVFSVICTPWPS